MKKTSRAISLSQARTRSARIRQLYHQLEEKNHGTRWSKSEDVVGFLYDFGELGRLVMAAEGRWVSQAGENAAAQLEAKLAECLWWLFVLSDRLDVDINKAFIAKLDELESSLSQSVKQAAKRKKKN